MPQIADLARAIERILGYDADPVFPSSLVLLQAMRDAIADPAALGIAALTATAWVLPATEDIASQNDPAASRSRPCCCSSAGSRPTAAPTSTPGGSMRRMMPSSLCSATEAATTTPWRSFCAALAEVAKVTGDSEAIAALGELLGRLPEPAPVERITVTADLEVLFHGGTSPLEELRALLDGRVIYDPDGLPVGKLSDVSVTETPTHTSERVSSALNRATDDILEAFEAPATGLHDGLNLLVNAAMSYLNGEAGDLEEVVAANWDAETTLSNVLSWIEDGTYAAHVVPAGPNVGRCHAGRS